MAFFPLELVTMLILPARVLPTAFVENERGGTERQISKQKQEQEQEQQGRIHGNPVADGLAGAVR